MKTLYERLSEESRTKIEDQSKEYPTTMLILKQFLCLSYNWGLMEIHNAMALNSALTTKAFDLDTFINFFDNE